MLPLILCCFEHEAHKEKRRRDRRKLQANSCDSILTHIVKMLLDLINRRFCSGWPRFNIILVWEGAVLTYYKSIFLNTKIAKHNILKAVHNSSRYSWLVWHTFFYFYMLTLKMSRKDKNQMVWNNIFYICTLIIV